jgi:hypothetical protein
MSQSSSEWKERFDVLVAALSVNAITPEQSSELNQLLDTQPGARRRFAEQMQLQSMLADGELAGETSAAAVVGAGSRVANAASFRWRILLATAAIGLLILLTWQLIGRRSNVEIAGEHNPFTDTVMDDGVAVITKMVGARWGDGSTVGLGSSVSPGRLRLEAGLVQFEFYRGAVVVAEGPAELEFLDADKMVFHQGKLRVRVPRQAEGFAVLSPHFELVDLGTEFGVRVAEDGSGNVRVYEGKVELYEAGTARSAKTRHEVLADENVSVSNTGNFESAVVEAETFVSSATLLQMANAEDRDAMIRWQTFRGRIQNDPRVIAYFDFQNEREEPRVLRSQSKQSAGENGSVLDGAIVGCSWAEGRWASKDSLEFKRPSDRVRIHLPGKHRSLTYSAWVRIDGIDRRFNSLVLTNGYDAGEAHWQLRSNGCLSLGLKTPVGHVEYVSKQFIDITRLGKWFHLATVYDSGNSEVVFYIDGKVISRHPVTTPLMEVQLGDTEIGNWGTPPSYSPTKIRNLNGRMDEHILFGEALGPDEIRRIHQLDLE